MSELPTTELEAVNAIIDTIGEPAVPTLTETGSYDVERAKQLLAREKKSLLKRGWWFNVEKRTLTPTVDNEILIPSNFLKVIPFHITIYKDRYCERGRKFYDVLEASTTVFTDPFDVTATINLPYEDLPEAAREVIFLEAAALFLRKTLGELQLTRFEALDAAEAMADLKREHRQNRASTLLDIPRIANRRHRYLNSWL